MIRIGNPPRLTAGQRLARWAARPARFTAGLPAALFVAIALTAGQ